MKTKQVKKSKMLITLIGIAVVALAVLALLFSGKFSTSKSDTDNPELNQFVNITLSDYESDEDSLILIGDEETTDDGEETDYETAVNDVYKAALKEINERYAAAAKELTANANAQIEAAIEGILGVEYLSLKDQLSALKENYNNLVNAFYSSEDYLALKAEIETKISELTQLSRKSAEYQEKAAEILALYDEINLLAADVSAQIAIINTEAREINNQIYVMFEENYNTILAETNIIVSQYNAELKTLSDARNNEISILQETMGIDNSINVRPEFKGRGFKTRKPCRR